MSSRLILALAILSACMPTVPGEDVRGDDASRIAAEGAPATQDALLSVSDLPSFVRLDRRPVLVTVRPEGDLTAEDVLANALDGTNWTIKRTLKNNTFSVFVDMDALEVARQAPDVTFIRDNLPISVNGVDEVRHIGATVTRRHGATGAGQTVAILDTGIDATHPAMVDRVVDGACFSSDVPFEATAVCTPGSEGVDAGAPPATAAGHDHGTHVAGITASVAPDADLLAVQVFSEFPRSVCMWYGYTGTCLLAYADDIIAGLEWVADQTDYDVASANLSLGGGVIAGACDDSAYAPAIEILRAAGTAVVIAAGNMGAAAGVGEPACVTAATTVGATDLDDEVAYFSQAGTQLDLLAPGVDVLSTVPGGGTATMSGTSMAAPHVAGAFAVLRSVDPEASVDILEGLLFTTGVPVTDDRNGVDYPRIQVDDAAIVLFSR